MMIEMRHRALRLANCACNPVLEGIHLLGHDIGGFAQRALEDLGELENRGGDLGKAIAQGNGAGHRGHMPMPQTFPVHDVMSAADRL